MASSHLPTPKLLKRTKPRSPSLALKSARSTPRWNYHVFLSFRGEDTRKSFTDHLYAALLRKGIVTFRDDEELKRGEVISEELVKAIRESLFAIIVFSQDYASSSWCLDELQNIVDSRKYLGRTVFPVFFGVDPSNIRHQKGNIGRAFKIHEEKFAKDEKKVQRWRESLTSVANLAGWTTKDKHEARIIEDIAEAIWMKLRVKLPSNFDHLVGIQSKVDKMITLMKIELSNKCFMGIWGMGGMGKTTLARVVYEAIQRKFETSCFLVNVREESESSGLVYLQKKLLSCLLQKDIVINDSHDGVKMIRHFLCNKKVLVVLDDISHISQLENLAGNKEWFGDGSRIIVTTRDIHLLTAHDQFEKYEIEMLNSDESCKLLCQRAFKKNYPEDSYGELSRNVIEYSGGLPLALQVLGSFLCKRSQSEWRDALDKMKQNLHRDIFKTLRMSYDGLEDEEYKTIFLDIACLFNGMEKIEVTKILENCGLHPTIGIKVLIEKSLLSYRIIDHKEFLYMHDLIQEMGRNIVLQESPNDAGRHSRLWSQDKVGLVLKGNKGTEVVQSIVLNLQQPYQANWHPDCFSKMSNLRLLYLGNVHLLHSLNSLSSALKVLIWERYPLEALPRIDQLYELVDLKLRHSKIRQLWNGTPSLGELKFINLSYSKDLKYTPDFSGVPNLENLFLEGCISLVEVHESLGQLKKLVKLNLKDCENLVNLPSKLEMNSLEEFILSGCSKLEKLPEFGENMKSLSIFDVSESNIREVPWSIIHSTNLKGLSLRGCKRLASNKWSLSVFSGHQRLPSSGLGLSLLKKLDLSFCNLCDGSIHDDLSGLSSLMKLDLRGNNFASLPSGCITNLLNLEQLDLNGCRWLQSMPELPPNLIRVDASCCYSMGPLPDLQHLFASLVSKHRNLLVYEDIVLLIQGDKIPTWFEQRKYYFHPNLKADVSRVSIITDIPYDFADKRKWSGIAVCLLLRDTVGKPRWISTNVHWRFKDPNDEKPDSYRYGCSIRNPSLESQLYIAFFPFNRLNCWRHLTSERHQLELQISIERRVSRSDFWLSESGRVEILDCGWRLICKKDFDTCNAKYSSGNVRITELDNDKSAAMNT